MNASTPCLDSAADIIGSKWTAQILREFSGGAQRFCELERAIPDINPRTLTKRLEELQERSIIEVIDGGGYNGYQLTAKGHDLIPILQKMAEWAAKYPRDPSWNVA